MDIIYRCQECRQIRFDPGSKNKCTSCGSKDIKVERSFVLIFYCTHCDKELQKPYRIRLSLKDNEKCSDINVLTLKGIKDFPGLEREIHKNPHVQCTWCDYEFSVI